MRLLLLCGSVRAGSTNEAVLRTVPEVAPGDVDAVFFPGLGALPHFNPDDDREPLPSGVVALRAAIAAADALLICTPEYAGDMPGSFKNLLDWTVGGVETEQKPAAWINASTSPSGASGTHDVLRTVLGYTGCDVVDDACARVPVPRALIHDGVVADPASRAEIASVVRALRAHVVPRA
ncbi:MAG TPA: NADPH-dependent FMN reductase [Acidimicrobiia bacterium]